MTLYPNPIDGTKDTLRSNAREPDADCTFEVVPYPGGDRGSHLKAPMENLSFKCIIMHMRTTSSLIAIEIIMVCHSK